MVISSKLLKGYEFARNTSIVMREEHMFFFIPPLLRRSNMAENDFDDTTNQDASEREHTQSVDCWCNPVVEAFGVTEKD